MADRKITSMDSLADATAAILAGGLGTRLRSVVTDRPKVMAEIRGRPFLAHVLDQLSGAGVREVVLCTGYLGEQVQSMFTDSYNNLRLLYSQESLPLGTAGALRLALPLFKSDPVLVMNGDSFLETDLRAFWAWHHAHRANVSLALVKMHDTRRYGRVHVDDEGAVVSFDEKRGKSTSGWINAGIYVIARPVLLTIPPNRAVSLEEEIFPVWIGRGLYGHCSKGRFLDIGTPESYSMAEKSL